MQTCDHLNQLMSQVLQISILQILILQSQILSMFTPSSERSPDALQMSGQPIIGFVYARTFFGEK